jgi:predicted CXXCH cytochrome family protein
MARMLAAGVCVTMVLLAGCSAASRRKVLTFLFDGVPPPKEARTQETGAAEVAASSAPSRAVQYTEHGPYAARLCDACHQAGATNVLVAPKDVLCARCHDLRLDRKYVHGPLASGGCLACHDPHSSRYRYLLVSESDDFCLRCHDLAAISRNAAHEGNPASCTSCHDAHLSDKKYLLK